jgi:hypothetical protein
MADVEKIKEKISEIGSFKNATVNYNEEKDIYDIYVKIRGDEREEYINTKDALDSIEGLEWQYNAFGIFELWFSVEDSEKIMEELQDKF